MASAHLPTNPVALYWVWWNPFKRLVDFPTTYNVIFLFHAYPPDGEATGGDTGAVELRKPSGTIGTNYNADIATCRARGQKILISVGGAGGQVYITSQARADAFVQSIKDINAGIGGSGTTAAFDGIDWNNFEGVSQGSQGAWMTYAGQQLQNYYGSQLIFTSPPAAFAGGQDVSDRLLLAELYQGGVLDWLCPQYYDPSNLNTEAKIATYSDFYNTAVTVNGSSVQIPRDHIGIGFSCANVATTSRWSFTGAATAYTNAVNAGYAPKGAFNWANHEDTGDQFATTVAPVITNNTTPTILADAFNLSTSSQFTNGAATTAQLTAPSGKTSGADFQAGSINETSNPAASLNLASGKYTELEWCIQATTDSVNATQYEFRVTYNGTQLDTYSVTPKWTIGTPPAPPDITAPTVPQNLNATTASSTQINLTWQASTDAVGVTGYRIYRGGTLLTTSVATSYADTGLTASTLYSYTVSAIDAAGNESAQSTSDSDTTSATPVGDTTAPVLILNNPDPSETVSGTYSFEAFVTDNVGVTSVDFYIGGTLIGTDTTGSSNIFSVSYDTTLKSNGTYLCTAVGYDAAGNSDSEQIAFFISNAGSPPLVPDPPKSCNSLGSVTGVSSITL